MPVQDKIDILCGLIWIMCAISYWIGLRRGSNQMANLVQNDLWREDAIDGIPCDGYYDEEGIWHIDH